MTYCFTKSSIETEATIRLALMVHGYTLVDMDLKPTTQTHAKKVFEGVGHVISATALDMATIRYTLARARFTGDWVCVEVAVEPKAYGQPFTVDPRVGLVPSHQRSLERDVQLAANVAEHTLGGVEQISRFFEDDPEPWILLKGKVKVVRWPADKITVEIALQRGLAKATAYIFLETTDAYPYFRPVGALVEAAFKSECFLLDEEGKWKRVASLTMIGVPPGL